MCNVYYFQALAAEQLDTKEHITKEDLAYVLSKVGLYPYLYLFYFEQRIFIYYIYFMCGCTGK